ncbi:MAG: dihydropteroate synthase, partial [Clostridiales bacterium]|nr:dihydropteroate synthase [Clostridiales bacterium]
PDHIRACVEESSKHRFCYQPKEAKTRVTGTTTCVEIGPRVVRCGERLNPTGKKKMKQALLEGRLNDIVDEGLTQMEAGADVLDVNVGVPGIDEAGTMTELIMMLQEVIDAPLQIDSSDPKVIEKACRLYNGIPLINSVNGKKEVMDAVFPVVKKYGGVVLGLCIDEDGIPPTAEQRFSIAQRIVDEAAKYDIPRSRIIIDSLVLTASAQQKEVIETAKCVGLVTDRLGCGTALGLSNVSFGLPNRPLINRTFLVMALYAGLKMPIMNPLDRELMGAIDAFEVLNAHDLNAEDYISRHVNDAAVTAAAVQTQAAPGGAPADEMEGSPLFKSIVKGQKRNAVDAVKDMADMAPLEIVSEHLIPALDRVGKDYDSGKIFLPQLMVSAETAKLVFDEIKSRLVTSDGGEKKGPVVIATVEADVHDIGKNIVKVVLQSYGFEVIDLGKDVKASVICDAVREYNPIAVGLSALMTTTVVYMENTIKALREMGSDVPVLCGGAVLTQEVTDNIGGDYYGKDAMETVRICEKLNEERKADR